MVNAIADLEMFVLLHGEHGRITPVWGCPTFSGQRVEVVCACGVMLGRWVTTEDAGLDMALATRRQVTGHDGQLRSRP